MQVLGLGVENDFDLVRVLCHQLVQHLMRRALVALAVDGLGLVASGIGIELVFRREHRLMPFLVRGELAILQAVFPQPVHRRSHQLAVFVEQVGIGAAAMLRPGVDHVLIQHVHAVLQQAILALDDGIGTHQSTARHVQVAAGLSGFFNDDNLFRPVLNGADSRGQASGARAHHQQVRRLIGGFGQAGSDDGYQQQSRCQQRDPFFHLRDPPHRFSLHETTGAVCMKQSAEITEYE